MPDQQASYRRDGIFEKVQLRQTEIKDVMVIIGWGFVWYIRHVLLVITSVILTIYLADSINSTY